MVISDLHTRDATKVCDRQHEVGSAGGEGVRGGRLQEGTVEEGGVPVCELEVAGLIRVDAARQISEVLWIKTVLPAGAHLQGLALRLRSTVDFLTSISLWISWIILSLGKLVISLF